MVALRFGPKEGPPRNPSAPGPNVRKSPQEVSGELGRQMFGKAEPVATGVLDFVTPATPLGTASQAMTPVDPSIALGGTALGLGAGAVGMLRGRPKGAAKAVRSVAEEAGEAMEQVARSPNTSTVSNTQEFRLKDGRTRRGPQTTTRFVRGNETLKVSLDPPLVEVVLGGVGADAPGPTLINLADEVVEKAIRQADDLGAKTIQIDKAGHVLEARYVAESAILSGWDPTISPNGTVRAARAKNMDALGEGGRREIRPVAGFYSVRIHQKFDEAGTTAVIDVNPRGGVVSVDFGDADTIDGAISFFRSKQNPKRGMKVMRWVNANLLQEMEMIGANKIVVGSDLERATAYANFAKKRGFDVNVKIDDAAPRTSLNHATVTATLPKERLKSAADEAVKELFRTMGDQ